MRNYSESLGLDISKSHFDAVLHQKQLHRQFDNNQSGFKALNRWIKDLKYSWKDILVCFENTGYYSLDIAYFLSNHDIDYIQEHGLQIKRSIGFRRGKSDKADAYDIAFYCWQNRSNALLSSPPTIILSKLKQLNRSRDILIKQRVALMNQIKALSVVRDKEIYSAACKSLNKVIISIDLQIKNLENTIKEVIESDSDIERNYRLCTSVKGIGPVLATELILHTHNFTCFNSWRKFAAYSGTVPYPYQSGSSINWRAKIHPFCDKKLKSLLTMGAISAMKCDMELKQYYKKRIEEGKPKMSVINIIRNKLIARVFAVIKRGTPYVMLDKYAA
jgi:transposase